MFLYENLFGAGTEREFKPTPETPDGEGLPIVVNDDVITSEFLADCAKQVGNVKTSAKLASASRKEQKNPDSSDTLDMFADAQEKIAFMSRTLGGRPGEDDPTKRALKSWKMKRKDGSEVKVCYETFAAMPITLLSRLFNFCVYEAAEPTKKKKAQSVST
jgi:hypothetical protein